MEKKNVEFIRVTAESMQKARIKVLEGILQLILNALDNRETIMYDSVAHREIEMTLGRKSWNGMTRHEKTEFKKGV